VTPDNERQRAWREAVQAFRLVTTALKDPAPALFTDLVAPEEGLRDLLVRELSLVSFSPFGALPNDIAGSRSAPQPAEDPGRTLDYVAGYGPTRSDAKDLPRAVSSRDDEPAVRPPVFSFRRSDPAASHRRPSRREQEDTREGSVEEGGESASYTERFRVPGDRRLPPPVAGDAGLDPSGATRPETATDDHYDADSGREVDDYTPGVRGSPRPMALLDSLADGFLEAEGWGSNLPVRGSGNSSEDAYRTERGIDLPEHETPGNSAIALIDSLAEYLLPAPTVEDLPGSGGNTPGVAASTTPDVADHPEEAAAPDRTPFAFLDSAPGGPASDELVFSTKLSDEVSGIVSDRHVDAGAFASLVNEALVEQARRHGVDLS